MSDAVQPIKVSLLAIPDGTISTLTGMYDALNCFSLLGSFEPSVPAENPFQSEIVARTGAVTQTASGVPVTPHRSIDAVDRADIVIIPSMLVEGGDWIPGRYPEEVAWLERMHAQGALICSACSGVLLLAETGLLDGREATIHWSYARTFERNFPNVPLRLDKVLITTGPRQEFIMSGASASWHDLVLYLITRQIGPTATQAMAKFLLLQWHVDGQAPYIVFEPVINHGDADILRAQDWLGTHFSEPAPIEDVVSRSDLAERSFKRRFTKATGLTPIAYVQQLRVAEAKRRLERTDAPIDEIGWAVGYEDPAFFRRLFKRITRITPGAYRKKFRVPDFATSDAVG